jgi:N6-L-threonylcarbamoyladenine synthase
MSTYLGIDTSNYTTSAALFDSSNGVVLQKKKPLPVKKGEKGLRQSDALFHHTEILPKIIDQLMHESKNTIDAVGVSDKPRAVEGSYMPCFLAGLNTAICIAAACHIPVHRFSHQAGHLVAALYSAERLELLEERFLAFHISGGTTELLLVQPDDKNIIKTDIIGKTLDLNAGQAVDRVGVMLGLDFPCGPELEKMALNSTKNFTITPKVESGNCCLSGLENKCATLFANGEKAADISLYCFEFIAATLIKMTEFAKRSYGDLPLVFSGGVMSNDIIRQRILTQFNASFAQPEFSADNAAGVALLAYYCDRRGRT